MRERSKKKRGESALVSVGVTVVSGGKKLGDKVLTVLIVIRNRIKFSLALRGCVWSI